MIFAVPIIGKETRRVINCFFSSTLKSQLERRKTSSALVLNNIPLEVRDHVKLLLNLEPSGEQNKTPSREVGKNSESSDQELYIFIALFFPSVRPDASQLAKIPFFEDVGAMALHFLDTLFQKVR